MATVSAARRTHLINIYAEVLNCDIRLASSGIPPDEAKRLIQKRATYLLKLRSQLSHMNREDFLRGRGASVKHWDGLVERAGRDV